MDKEKDVKITGYKVYNNDGELDYNALLKALKQVEKDIKEQD